MTLKDKLKQLPNGPGIYLIIDVHGNIIYVGKAKNLKNRVSQYFRVQKNREPKVAELIGRIHDFKVIEMDTELDAFIEECRLIKELKPRYNRQLKSTANYHYLKIGLEAYPKLSITQDKGDDQAEYFGPFRGNHYLQKVVEFLQDYYPIRKCSTPGLPQRKNGCLFLQLGSCLGPCTGKISEVDYRRQIDQIKRVLKGEEQAVLTGLAKRSRSQP